jgi:hypothetical protein
MTRSAAGVLVDRFSEEAGRTKGGGAYVSATARLLELKVTLAPANGTLVVYSPGYEEQWAQFSEELSFGRIPFVEPVLCIRSIGGPFEFNIDIVSIEDLD